MNFLFIGAVVVVYLDFVEDKVGVNLFTTINHKVRICWKTHIRYGIWFVAVIIQRYTFRFLTWCVLISKNSATGAWKLSILNARFGFEHFQIWLIAVGAKFNHCCGVVKEHVVFEACIISTFILEQGFSFILCRLFHILADLRANGIIIAHVYTLKWCWTVFILFHWFLDIFYNEVFGLAKAWAAIDLS